MMFTQEPPSGWGNDSHGCRGITIHVEEIEPDLFRVEYITGCGCWQTSCDSRTDRAKGQFLGKVMSIAELLAWEDANEAK